MKLIGWFILTLAAVCFLWAFVGEAWSDWKDKTKGHG